MLSSGRPTRPIQDEKNVLITIAAALAALWIVSIVVVAALCRASAIGDAKLSRTPSASYPEIEAREPVGAHADHGLGGVFLAH